MKNSKGNARIVRLTSAAELTVVFSLSAGHVAAQTAGPIKLRDQALGLGWSSAHLLVAEHNADTIAVIDPASIQVSERLTVMPKPVEAGVLYFHAQNLGDQAQGKVYPPALE